MISNKSINYEFSYVLNNLGCCDIVESDCTWVIDRDNYIKVDVDNHWGVEVISEGYYCAFELTNMWNLISCLYAGYPTP